MTPLEQIESIVKKNIPTFYEMVQAHKATKEIIIMHTDAFGTTCEETDLLGCAVKYATENGLEMHIIPYQT